MSAGGRDGLLKIDVSPDVRPFLAFGVKKSQSEIAE